MFLYPLWGSKHLFEEFYIVQPKPHAASLSGRVSHKNRWKSLLFVSRVLFIKHSHFVAAHNLLQPQTLTGKVTDPDDWSAR